jgi:hypothetical protein
MKKSIVCMLLIAAVVFSVFAVLPIRLAHCVDDDPFQYSYPYVTGPPPNCAWIGELHPGESTPSVTVVVTVSGGQGITFPITQTLGWHATLLSDDGEINWPVSAIPGPTYTWDSLTTEITVKIQVTVPIDWPEECVTFRAKLWPGQDSSTNPHGIPTPQTIGSGDGVHFKVCVKPLTVIHKIECNSFMTDSNFNVITSFDTVWTPRDPKGRDYYKLSSTNPGQFMYNIEIQNTGTVDVTSLTVTYTIPSDFILKGADPTQVWTEYAKAGIRISTVTIVGNTITITYTLVPGAELWITFHLEYGPARSTFPAAVATAWKTNHPSYTFSEDCVATFSDGYTPYTCSSSTVLYDPTVVLGVEN